MVSGVYTWPFFKIRSLVYLQFFQSLVLWLVQPCWLMLILKILFKICHRFCLALMLNHRPLLWRMESRRRCRNSGISQLYLPEQITSALCPSPLTFKMVITMAPAPSVLGLKELVIHVTHLEACLARRKHCRMFSCWYHLCLSVSLPLCFPSVTWCYLLSLP